MAGSELLLGVVAGAAIASVFWTWHCRRLREEFDRERERELRIARRSRLASGAVRKSDAPAREVVLDRPEGNSPAAASRRLTVLVVEPDADSRRQLVTRLSDCGHRVVPTGEVEQALEMARRLRFDLVLAAAGFPGADWIGIWERFRSLAPNVALLASVEGADRMPAPPEVNVPILLKPVDPGELDRLLSRAASRQNGAARRA